MIIHQSEISPPISCDVFLSRGTMTRAKKFMNGIFFPCFKGLPSPPPPHSQLLYTLKLLFIIQRSSARWGCKRASRGVNVYMNDERMDRRVGHLHASSYKVLFFFSLLLKIEEEEEKKNHKYLNMLLPFCPLCEG